MIFYSSGSNERIVLYIQGILKQLKTVHMNKGVQEQRETLVPEI